LTTGSDILGYWHQRATERHGNPPPKVTKVTLLIGRQEGHLACKKLDVGGDDLTGALHGLQLRYIVQLSPPPPSKMAIKTETDMA